MSYFLVFTFLLSFLLQVILCENKELKNTIDRIHQPTQNEFYQYYLRNEPVIITGVMDRWDLSNEKWTDEGLIKICGNNTIQVRVITSENKALTRGGYVREEMKFSEYIEKYKTKQEDNKLYYAAGILLPQYLPQLLDHILEPKYLKFKLMQSKTFSPRMYFGAGGQSIPIHFDEVENLLHLVDGTKEVTLFSPTNRARELLYLGDDSKHTWSPVDIDGDLTNYPKFKEAIPIKFTLVPGEILYIPIYWFHHVKSSDSRSLSFNFWYRAEKNKIKQIKPLLFPKEIKKDL